LPGELVDPVSVGDAAALVGAELGLADPAVFTRVVEAWAELVGEALAAHSWIRAVRGPVVEIAVDSPAWATELRYLEGDLLARVSQLVGPGVVEAVRVSVQPSRPGPPEPGTETSAW
jgi:predicted nucleic acid-binding Zn ribbon protein